MARVCDICGKRTRVANNVSHANNKTKRKVFANLQSVHAVFDEVTYRITVCTQCIKSGRVTKPARRKAAVAV